MSRRAAPAVPEVWPYIAARTATLAVGRSQRSAAATGAYRSSSCAARARPASPDTTASTRGSTWPRSARTSTCPGSARTAGRSSAGQVVQAGRGGHAARRAVGRAPRAAQPPVGADRAVEPRPAVRRRRALGLAPRAAAPRPPGRSRRAAPGARSGCRAGRSRRGPAASLHLRGRAQVDGADPGTGAGRRRRARRPAARRSASSVGRGPSTSVSSASTTARSSGSPACSSSTASSAAADSDQAVSTVSGTRPGARARVGQGPQPGLLRDLRPQRQLGPPPRVLGPGAAQPLAAELAVRPQRRAVRGVEVEQVEAAGRQRRRLEQVVGGGPDRRRVVAAQPVQQAAHRAEVPAGADVDTGRDEGRRGLARRPPGPPRPQRREVRHHLDDPGAHAGAAAGPGEPHLPLAGRDRERRALGPAPPAQVLGQPSTSDVMPTACVARQT